MLSEKEKLDKLTQYTAGSYPWLMSLSSARVYKEAWDESDVLSTIEKEAGHQFDPELVEIFFSRLNVLRSIQER